MLKICAFPLFIALFRASCKPVYGDFRPLGKPPRLPFPPPGTLSCQPYASSDITAFQRSEKPLNRQRRDQEGRCENRRRPFSLLSATRAMNFSRDVRPRRPLTPSFCQAHGEPTNYRASSRPCPRAEEQNRAISLELDSLSGYS